MLLKVKIVLTFAGILIGKWNLSYLIWVLVIWVCLVCDNSPNHPFIRMYAFFFLFAMLS